jgi:hypothetical protein
LRFFTWFHKGQAKNGQGGKKTENWGKRKSAKKRKTRQCEKFDLINFSFLARQQKNKRPISLLGEM